MSKKDTKNKGKQNQTPTIQAIQNLGNASKTTIPSNEFVVITKADNLAHNYFHYCEVYWDIGDCLSQAIIRFSKSDHSNTNYWIRYEGDIWLYMGHDIHKDSKNNQEYYDLDVGEPPFFVGEVYDVQEYAYEFEVKIRSIGFRFKQSIPDDFRQKYINGQNVRDAFQAICEFLGVKYICPPQNIQTNANASPEGTEKDLDQAKKKEEALAKEIAKKASEELNKDKETDDKNQDENQNENQDSNNESTQDMPQQGYANVSFDANGAITYNSTVIEISPDTTQTLLSMQDDAFSIYVEDDTNVIEDVKDFLNHKIFEEIHPFYLDYGAITITPSSTDSSSMSSAGGAGSGAEGGSGSPADQEAITSLSSLVQKYYPASKNKNKWVNKLKECDTNWTAVATVVNQMGGDKDKQNDVISQALKIKKEYNKKKEEEKKNKKPTYKAKTAMNAAGLPAPNVSDQTLGKALGKTLFNK